MNLIMIFLLDVVARLSKNTYRGVSRISCYLVDLKLSDCNSDYILEQKSIYSEFKEKDIISKGALKLLHPSRNDFALVYRYIKTINNKFLRVDIINYRIFKNDDCLLKLNVILDIFKELGILDLYSRGDEIKVNVRNLSQKVNIEKSKLFSNICRKEREDLLGKRI